MTALKLSAASLSVLVLLLVSCSSKPQESENNELNRTEEEPQIVTELTAKEGLQMLQLYCYACHNPNTQSHDEMLAPPLAGIKNRYKNTYANREEFIVKMAEFISMPSKDKALMKGPIKRFGLMPTPALTDKAKIEALVTFIYDTPIETPDWFAKHYEEKHGEVWEEK